MTHRERVLAAINHREPDRVPLFYRDVPEVEQRLLRDLDLTDREELLQYFDIDFRWVEPGYIGPCLSGEETGRRRDIWGAEYQYTPFRDGAGYWEVVSHPLAHVTDPKVLESYAWPSLDWFDFSTLADPLGQFADHAIMTAPGFASPGVLQSAIQALVGMEKSLIDMAINTDFFKALIRHVLAFLEPFVDRMMDAGGGRIDFFRVGDDFGTQNGLMFSRAQWCEFMQPAYRSLKAITRKHGAYLYLHSCGAIRELIPDFLETGVDALDPLQVRAAGMNPAELKRKYGNTMCFSGGVDEQELLREGTPDDVKSGVQQLLEIMAPDGGFFLGPTHNFQDDIPTANIVAMYEAAREWKY